LVPLLFVSPAGGGVDTAAAAGEECTDMGVANATGAAAAGVRMGVIGLVDVNDNDVAGDDILLLFDDEDDP
jgi:hypothetical protein